MHRTNQLIGIACTCLGLSLGPAVWAGESGQLVDYSGRVQQAFCWSSHNEYTEPAMYISDVFEIRVPKNSGVWYPRDMGKVFASYLRQQHGYVDTPNPTVFCSLHDTAQMAQGSKDLLIKQHQYYRQQTVETGWRMSAQQAEAAATAAAAKPATLAPSAPPSPSMAYGYCKSSDYRIAYYSAAFGSPIANPQTPAWDPIKATAVQWRQAFIEFLKKKHDFVGYTQCPSYASKAESQKDFDNMIGLARQAPPGQSVETGWVYVAAAAVASAPAAPVTPPKPAAPAAAAPPPPRPATIAAARPVTAQAPATVPAAGSGIHAVCWADQDPATRYYSAIFNGSGSDYGEWMPAFKQFMQQKYNYRRTVRCTKQPNLAEAKKYRAQMIADARSISLPGGTHPKIIETGWTYP